MRELLPRLKRLDQLIQLELTGRPTELAGKIGISERSIYDYIKLMRQMGAPIKFSHERRSHYYEPAGSFRIGFNSET